MSPPCVDRYELLCKAQFAHLCVKLDRLDVAIRGNGQPGIMVRLDRVEASRTNWSRLAWMVVGAAVTCVAGLLVRKILGG